MSQQHWGTFCTYCHRHTMHVRDMNEPNHVAHLLATLFLCGLWLPVWLLFAMASQPGPWVCTQCGGAHFD